MIDNMSLAATFLGAGIGAFFPGPLPINLEGALYCSSALPHTFFLSIACALVTEFWSLIALRFAQGVTCAGLTVIPAAIVRDHVGGDRMARLMSLIMMVFLIVPIIAPAVGQIILMVADWRAIFSAMALAGLVVGFWVWLRLPETLTEDAQQNIDLTTIIANMKEAVTKRSRSAMFWAAL